MGQFADLANLTVYGSPVDNAKKPSRSAFVAIFQALDDLLAADPTVAGLVASTLGGDILAAQQGSEVEDLLFGGPGIGTQVIINTATAYTLDPDNYFPHVVYYGRINGGGGTVRLDCSAMQIGRTYCATAGVDTVLDLDFSSNVYIQGSPVFEADTTLTDYPLASNTTVFFRKEEEGFVYIWTADGVWFATGTSGFSARKMADGFYEVRYTRTSAIAATTAGDITGPTQLNFNSAYVVSSVIQPLAAGTALPASPVQITKRGTTGGLATSNMFTIYNPNASTTGSSEVLIVFKGVVGP